MGKLFSVRTLSEHLDLNEDVIRNMHYRGRLPKPLKIGKRVYWREEVITEWLDSLQKKTEEQEKNGKRDKGRPSKLELIEGTSITKKPTIKGDKE